MLFDGGYGKVEEDNCSKPLTYATYLISRPNQLIRLHVILSLYVAPLQRKLVETICFSLWWRYRVSTLCCYFFVLLGSAKVTLCFLSKTWLGENLLFDLSVFVLARMFLFEPVCCSLLVTSSGLTCLFELEESCFIRSKIWSCITCNCRMSCYVVKLSIYDTYLSCCGVFLK